jgi:hypothetical protein
MPQLIPLGAGGLTGGAVAAGIAGRAAGEQEAQAQRIQQEQQFSNMVAQAVLQGYQQRKQHDREDEFIAQREQQRTQELAQRHEQQKELIGVRADAQVRQFQEREQQQQQQQVQRAQETVQAFRQLVPDGQRTPEMEQALQAVEQGVLPASALGNMLDPVKQQQLQLQLQSQELRRQELEMRRQKSATEAVQRGYTGANQVAYQAAWTATPKVLDQVLAPLFRDDEWVDSKGQPQSDPMWPKHKIDAAVRTQSMILNHVEEKPISELRKLAQALPADATQLRDAVEQRIRQLDTAKRDDEYIDRQMEDFIRENPDADDDTLTERLLALYRMAMIRAGASTIEEYLQIVELARQ